MASLLRSVALLLLVGASSSTASSTSSGHLQLQLRGQASASSAAASSTSAAASSSAAAASASSASTHTFRDGGKQLQTAAAARKASTFAFTFVNAAGSFPGMPACISGVMEAHTHARWQNLPIEDLPKYMEEYCAEDVARALGVSHKDLQKVWTQVWAKHRASVLGSATPDAHSVDVVTQRRELIRMPFEKTIPVLKRVCVQIGQFYEPARFANRDDAAEFCRVVKQIVQTNKATVPVAAAPPAVVDEPAPVPAASPPPGSPCAKGGKLYGTLQCGTLHDGTKMDITGGRMHPEAVAEESREETQRKAQIEAQIVGAKLDGIDKKIASLKVHLGDKGWGVGRGDVSLCGRG